VQKWMNLKARRRRLDTVTEATTWKTIISFITTLERIFTWRVWINYLSGAIESLEGEKKKFCFVMICILWSYWTLNSFLNAGRWKLRTDWPTVTLCFLLQICRFFLKEESIFAFPMSVCVDVVCRRVNLKIFKTLES
jgi:hypothetical protein